MNILRAVALIMVVGLSPAWSPDRAGAITNEEFMELCAGERGPSGAAAIKSALDSGAEVNYSGKGGITPLMVFVSSHQDGDWQAVSGLRILLKAGAEVNARSDDGGTALSYAALNKAGPRIISTLLQHGADVNQGVEAAGGITPLMIAASLDPDPVVSALLLAAGAKTDVVAEKSGQTSTLLEMAQQNPNPRVRRFIEAMAQRKDVSPKGLPLFADLPDDRVLKEKITGLDEAVRKLISGDDWLGWLSYIKWQIDLAGNVELRRSAFGNTPGEAWLNEYQYYLQALEESGERSAYASGETSATRLVIQGGWPLRPDGGLDIISAYERRLIIMRRSDHGALVGYEKDSGRELWRYTPSALSGFYLIGQLGRQPEAGAEGLPVLKAPGNQTSASLSLEESKNGASGRKGPLLLVTSHWGDQFGDAALLDPLNGRILLDLPPLDSPKWTVDDQNRVLAISTDYSLDIFDLQTLVNSRHSWYSYLESRSWDEAKLAARSEQNDLLAPFNLKLDHEGRFTVNNNDLFQPVSEPDPERLMTALEALKEFNYEPLELMALDRRNLRGRNFVLGPQCIGNCEEADLETPLFLVSQAQNRIDTLMVDNSPEKILTRGQLGWTKDPGDSLRPLITFSPGGVTLAVTESGGDVHFFSIPENGRFLGSLPGQTVLDSTSGATVKDSRLLALLDDDDSGRPLAAFALPGRQAPAAFAAQIDLAGQKITSVFRPRPGAAQPIKAYAVSPEDDWAVGLGGGALWKAARGGRDPEKLMDDGNHDWTALAFSGDGNILLAAEREGGLYVFEAGRDPRRLELGIKNIRHLALDQEGQLAWAAGDQYGRNAQPALALIDLSGRNKTIYRAGAGPILSLNYNLEAGYAVAVEEQPPPAKAEPQEVKSLDVVRWRQGRADIIKFDHLRRLSTEGGQGVYDAELVFAGLSPDLGSFYFQELSPSRAFVNLGRETVNSRHRESLESFTYQSAIGLAAFSPDGRLVLLPEKGRGGNEDDHWPYQAAGAFYIYDQDSGREIAYMSDRSRHPAGLRGASFLKDGSRVLTFGRDGGVRQWDLTQSRPVNTLSWVFLQNGNWAAIDQSGRFDSPAPDYLTGLHWVTSGAQSVLPILATLEDFFQPRLAAYAHHRAELPPLKPLAERSLFLPEVKIVDIKGEPEAPGRVAVSVELSSEKDTDPQALQVLQLFRDGRLVATAGTKGRALKLDEDGKFRTTFRNLALPALKDQAVFSASALNADGLRSSPAQAALKYKSSRHGEPTLFLVGLGINEFTNPAWNLNYAADDASAYARILPRYFTGGRAEGITLTGGGNRARPSLANLRASLQSLSPHLTGQGKFAGAGPDDVVFVALSSRGFTFDHKYRLLASDIEGREQTISPELLASTFSADELQAWLENLEAGEIILVLDGYLPDRRVDDKPVFDLGTDGGSFEPGPMGDRGLALLAYYKKIRFLSSSGRSGLAAAHGSGGLGLTAYALLADGLENKQVAAEGHFTFSRWLDYGRRRISELNKAFDPQGVQDIPPPGLLDFGGPGQALLRADPPK